MLSLSELTKQLQEGSLNPEDVFYTYMEKVHHQYFYLCQPMITDNQTIELICEFCICIILSLCLDTN